MEERGRKDYRNAVYQGGTKDGLRHGPGILVLDDASLHLGFWAEDRLDGPFLHIVSQEEYFYGEKRLGELHGVSVFRDQHHLLLGEFERNQPCGVFLWAQRQSGMARLYRLQDDSVTFISEKQFDPATDFFPGLIFRRTEIEKYVTGYERKHQDLLTFAESLIEDLSALDPQMGLVRFGKSLTYFGFTEEKKAEGLGLLVSSLEETRVASIGCFKANEQEGVARIYFHNQFVFEGNIEMGVIRGQAIKYSILDNTFVHGLYQQNSVSKVISTGEGFPFNIALLIRKRWHLSSYHFQNRFAAVLPASFPDFQKIEADFKKPSRAEGKQKIKKMMEDSSVDQQVSRVQSDVLLALRQNLQQNQDYLPTDSDRFAILEPLFRTSGNQPKQLQNKTPIKQQAAPVPSSQSRVRNSDSLGNVLNRVARSIQKKKRQEVIEQSPEEESPARPLPQQSSKFNRATFGREEPILQKEKRGRQDGTADVKTVQQPRKKTLDQVYKELRIAGKR